MSANSSIEWTDATWNPIRARNLQTGKIGWHCEHATTGCEFCYSEGFNKRLGTGLPFKPGHRKDIEIFLDEDMLTAPLRWKKPRKIFVCSMTDLFADFVQDEWIDKMLAVMALCPQHTFQVLTKRAERMRGSLRDVAASAIGVGGLPFRVADQMPLVARAPQIERALNITLRQVLALLPLPNVWLGVSCERQEEADARIPLLLQTPAAVRFISAEPLLGPIDLKRIRHRLEGESFEIFDALYHKDILDKGQPRPGLDWVIVGGESGKNARPMHPQWARALRDQCQAAGVSFFFKQWGEFLPVGQHLPGAGKISGGTAVKPGRMKLHYAGSADRKAIHAFAGRGVKTTSINNDLLFRVRKKAAGRLLDGREWNEFPAVRP